MFVCMFFTFSCHRALTHAGVGTGGEHSAWRRGGLAFRQGDFPAGRKEEKQELCFCLFFFGFFFFFLFLTDGCMHGRDKGRKKKSSNNRSQRHQDRCIIFLIVSGSVTRFASGMQNTNNSRRRDLYFSCSDIYFRRRSFFFFFSSTQSYLADTNAHLHNGKNFIFLGATKVIRLRCVTPALCCHRMV